MNDNGKDDVIEIFEPGEEDDELYSMLDDDRRAELDELVGLQVAGLELWETSLGDEDADEPVTPENRAFFDVDLLFEGGMALELYVATVFPGPDSDPVVGLDGIYEIVGKLSDDELELLDFDQADEDGGLALAFGKGDKTHQVIVANAWMISEWEESDEDDDEEEEREV
jgi:hypothetical protein